MLSVQRTPRHSWPKLILFKLGAFDGVILRLAYQILCLIDLVNHNYLKVQHYTTGRLKSEHITTSCCGSWSKFISSHRITGFSGDT